MPNDPRINRVVTPNTPVVDDLQARVRAHGGNVDRAFFDTVKQLRQALDRERELAEAGEAAFKTPASEWDALLDADDRYTKAQNAIIAAHKARQS